MLLASCQLNLHTALLLLLSKWAGDQINLTQAQRRHCGTVPSPTELAVQSPRRMMNASGQNLVLSLDVRRGVITSLKQHPVPARTEPCAHAENNMRVQQLETEVIPHALCHQRTRLPALCEASHRLCFTRGELHHRVPISKCQAERSLFLVPPSDNSDLIACMVVSKDGCQAQRFLAVDVYQMSLVEPESKRLGWGVVKFAGLLQVRGGGRAEKFPARPFLRPTDRFLLPLSLVGFQ